MTTPKIKASKEKLVTPFQISDDLIIRLNSTQLTRLLEQLLYLEAREQGIPAPAVSVGLNITVPDGGVDAAIRWRDGPSSTEHLPSRALIFQCKADEMPTPKCVKELYAGQKLKPLVEEALQEHMDYVLFCSRAINVQGKAARLKAVMSKVVRLRGGKGQSSYHIRSAEDIAEWTNRFVAAVLMVQRVTGQTGVTGVISIEEWAQEFGSNRWPYYANAAGSAHITAIRDALLVERSCVRVVGLPGIGKSQLVLEAIKGDPTLGNAAVYINAAGEDGGSGIPHYVTELLRNDIRGVIVVDNCPRDLHMELIKKVAGDQSKLSLLSTWVDPLEDALPSTRSIRLERYAEGEIEALVSAYLPAVEDFPRQRIALLSGGFPFFAFLLTDSYKRGGDLVDVISNAYGLMNVVDGNDADKKAAFKTIQALALFEAVNFGDGTSEEAKTILALAGATLAAAKKHIYFFKKQDLIQEAYPYLRVRPHPFALRLCEGWWKEQPPADAEELLIKGLPASMLGALTERLRMMSHLAEARSLVIQLCGDAGPFGKAEVLGSARGARIFRALVEINPEACAKALVRFLDSLDGEATKANREARKEWVWSLQKLLFLGTTFQIAARALTKLALFETESYSNNATGILLGTFQVALPGTEANLDQRAEFFEELCSGASESNDLWLQALPYALKTDFFTRSGGAEEMGSGPALKDYVPRFRSEISDYWARILNAVEVQILEFSKLAATTLNQLASHIRGLVRAKDFQGANRIVELGVLHFPGVWHRAIEGISDVLRFEGPGLSQAELKLVDQWKTGVEPGQSDLAGRLSILVSAPVWSAVADVDSGSEDMPSVYRVEMRELARRCADQFAAFKATLPAMLHGEQRLGYRFGVELGGTSIPRDEFVSEAVEALLLPGFGPDNSSMLVGFLDHWSDADRPWVEQVMQQLMADGRLDAILPSAFSSLKPSIATLLYFVDLLKQGRIPQHALRIYAYGRALEYLPAAEIAKFVSAWSVTSDEAAWGALDVAFMACFADNKHKWGDLRDTIARLSTGSSLDFGKVRSDHDTWAWEQLCLKLLNDADVSLARRIAAKLVDAASKGLSSVKLPAELAQKLLSKFGESVWDVFGDALVKKRGQTSAILQTYLGRGLRGTPLEGGYPLESLDTDVLLGWLKTSSDCPVLVAGMIAPLREEDGVLEWTPLAKTVIEGSKYDRNVLSALSRNIWTGSFVGSRTGFLKQLRDFVQKIKARSSEPAFKEWATEYLKEVVGDLTRSENSDHAMEMGRYGEYF